MRIAICDESSKDREMLKKLLEEYAVRCRKKLELEEYNSGAELCRDKEILQRCRVIFLDTSADRECELKAAVQIKELHPDSSIVLLGFSMNGALDGYKVRASHFLLKDDLPQTIGECMNTILKETAEDNRTLQFTFVEGTVVLRPAEIIYIETNRHKNIFYTQKGNYSIYKKLNEIEKELSGLGFLRIHQSFLVNMRYVEKISSYIMRLTTGIELSVPKARYPGVKQQYTSYRENQLEAERK